MGTNNLKGTILIVDDTPANLGILFDFLAESGFKVLVAQDGESAIQKVEYALPDLILLDVIMLGIDGFETCQRLKTNLATQDIPIVFMTALSETVDKVKGLSLGAVDYITKPFQHEEVLARVNTHLHLSNLSKKLQEQNLRLEKEIQERKRVEQDLRRYTEELADWNNRYEAIVQASGQILYDWNSEQNNVVFSGNIEGILGYSTQEISGDLNTWIELIHPEDRPLFNAEINETLTTKKPFHLEYRVRRLDGIYIVVEDQGYFISNQAGNCDRMVGFVVDISERKRAESLMCGQKHVLEMIATGAPLLSVLDSLALMIEKHTNEALCSILELDSHSQTLQIIAAPSLPKTYVCAVRDIEISPNIGSCGQAAYLGKAVIVNDIATEPSWEKFRDLALNHQLRACWSMPIFSTKGQVLGTFGMYYRQPKTPDAQELQLCEIAAHIAGIAMERQQAEAEREQAFIALQQSEARFRRLFESNIIGIILSDANGNIKDANDAFLQMVGYRREDLLSGNLHWDKLTPPEYKDLDAQSITEFNHYGSFSPLEKEYIRKDGSRFPIMIGGTLLEQSQKMAVCFVIDISKQQTALRDRKLADEKILEQAELLDITTEAILVRGLDNEILFWNKGAERLYGWKQEEVVGKKADEILYKKIGVNQLKRHKRILAEQGGWQGELNQVTKDGQDIIVASRWTLVRDLDGKPKSILTVNTDITERKQLETQFLRAQRMESLGTLAGGIAHDLNNVLSPILMAVQLLQLKLNDDISQQWLTILENNAKRGADLVKQVLSFARGYEGEHTLIEVDDLIIETEQIIKETFPKYITVNTHIAPDLWFVTGDKTQLHQVLINLYINARDAMPEGGILSIKASNIFIDQNSARRNIDAKVGSYVLIKIVDTGTGIPPEILDRIFEPFFTTKEPGKGTGLGLSTVIGIIKGHRGFVEVESKPGKGTEFKVFLPATVATIKNEPQDINYSLPRGNGEVILVVDDEAAIRDITKVTLENYNYKVIVACDGIEAVALYAQHKREVDVVLIDMMMPLMDGSTTIRTLQKINPQVKIIAVSGIMPNPKMTEFFGSTVKVFIPKPYTSEELLENLYRVINRN